MTLTRTPFETTRDEASRAEDKGKVFTVRLNAADLEALEELKTILGLDADNSAIRSAIHLTLNVSRVQFAGAAGQLLFKKRRQK